MPILGLVINKRVRITTEQLKIMKLNLQRCNTITIKNNSFIKNFFFYSLFKLIAIFHIPGIRN